MENTIRRHKLGYVLGIIFCFTGLAVLLVVIWKAMPEVSSNTGLASTLWVFLWEEHLNLIPGVKLKLVYLIILATAILVSGVVVLAFSRQRFFLPGKTMRLKCPFCRKQWLASHDRGRVMCPHCHHMVHPKMVEG